MPRVLQRLVEELGIERPGTFQSSRPPRKIVGVVHLPGLQSAARAASYFSRFSHGTPSSQLYHFW